MLPLLITLQYVADTKNSIVDRLNREERGATAVEYGLIVGLIAIAIIAAITLVGDDLEELFTRIGGELDDAGPAAG